MDIRVTRSNKTFFRVDPCVAAILLEAFPGSFEIAQPIGSAPVKPDVSRFGIAQLPSGYSAVQRIRGAEIGYFDGFPQNLKNCWPDCPDEVEREYTRQFVHRAEVHSSEPKTIAIFEAFRKKLLGA